MSDSHPPDNTSATADATMSAKSGVKLNVLIVDDDLSVLGSTESIFRRSLSTEVGYVLSNQNPEEALEILKDRQAREIREAVHLLVSDLNIGSTDRGIQFLQEVRKLSPRPYTVVYSGYVQQTPELDELCHEVVQKAMASPKDKMHELLSKCRKYWKNLTKPTDENTSNDPLQKVLIVKIDDKMVAMSREEVEAYRHELDILGTVKEVLDDTDEEGMAQLRRDTAAMIIRLNQPPSKEVMELLQTAPDSGEAQEGETKIETYVSAQLSPLPAIPAKFCKYDPDNDNRTLVAKEGKEKGIHWTGLLDVDRTLYEAKSKHSIMLHDFAKFLKEQHSEQFVEDGGDLDELRELIERCDKWEAQRRMVSEKKYSLKKIRKILEMEEDEKFIEYSKGIEETGNMSALAFGGMQSKRLEEYGKEFMNSEYSGKFFDHTPSVIQKLRDHGIVPVCVTGAPDFLVPAILEKIGVAHGHGMTYKMDSNGRLLSGKEAGIEKNMGTAEEKAKYAKALTKLHYAIAFAMGDSVGDMGIIKAAATKSRTKEDIHGAAVMINASESAERELRRNYTTDMDRRVIVIPPKSSYDSIVAAVGRALRVVFEPLHLYRQPEQKEEVLRKLEKKRLEGKKHENLENIKRIRDALKAEGLNGEEVTDQLMRFYPEIVIEDVMKTFMLNLRDKNAVKTWLNRLQEVGELTREDVYKIFEANSILQAKSDSIQPTEASVPSIPPTTPPPVLTSSDTAALGEASTIPPSPTTKADATYQIVTPENNGEMGKPCTTGDEDYRESDLPPKDS